MPVAQQGHRGFMRNQRVVITGTRNATLARLVPFMPRETLLRMVRKLQSPAE
jgi:short-subunit dehydrogenase